MIGSNFDHFRNLLLDPSKEGMENRNNVRIGYLGIKVGAAAFTAVCSLSAVSALISSVSSPILGAIGALWAASGAVLGREVFCIAENVGNMFSENGITQNILGRLGNSFTSDWFVSSVFKDTWIAGPLLSSFCVEQLNRPKAA